MNCQREKLFKLSIQVCNDVNSGYKCSEIDCVFENVQPQIITITAKFKMWIPTFTIKKVIESLSLMLSAIKKGL